MLQPEYIEKFVVRYSEVDMYNSLKIRSVFDYLQQVAATHANILGCGLDNMQNDQKIWVLQRMSLELFKKVKADNILTVRTYPSGRERLFFRREFEVTDEAGERVLVGSSYWLVIDGATLRPVRNFTFDLPIDENKDKFCDYNSDLKISPEEIEKIKENYTEFKVNYSSVDVNLHLNNANYPMLVQDSLYEKIGREFEFKSFQISFNIARKFNENIKVNSIINDGRTFKAAGLNDDGKVIFEAAGTLDWN